MKNLNHWKNDYFHIFFSRRLFLRHRRDGGLPVRPPVLAQLHRPPLLPRRRRVGPAKGARRQRQRHGGRGGGGGALHVGAGGGAQQGPGGPVHGGAVRLQGEAGAVRPPSVLPQYMTVTQSATDSYYYGIWKKMSLTKSAFPSEFDCNNLIFFERLF